MQQRALRQIRSKMAEEKTHQKHEEKANEEKKIEANMHEKEAKKIEPISKKVEVKQKKEEAIANGRSLPVSMKQCKYICAFIKNKSIDNAIQDLEQVIKMKKAVPFKGEIPHRKGKVMMAGRYPVKASKLFITLLKGLKGNSIVNGLDIDKTRITTASASWASRPMRRGSVQGKRTHVILKAREANK